MASVGLMAAVLAIGCASEERGLYCRKTTDCFDGELCINNACEVTDDSSLNNSTTNNTGNNAGNNTGNNGTNLGRKCVLNPFTATCDDPELKENNTWSQAVYFTNRAVGCHGSGEFVVIDETLSRIMCANEPADWYQMNTVDCSTHDFFIEISLTVKGGCDPGLLDLKVESYDCDHVNVYCPPPDATTRKVIVKFPATGRNSVGGFRFAVESVDQGDPQRAPQVEYDLHILVR
ncbi:MAG: hypothetical protein H0U74_08550 [Bradymonadaceae bacterium]|nr:hypothetical protein [Lujinxingiaceae bacterium]